MCVVYFQQFYKGVKKSAVATNALESSVSQTAASSPVSVPTRRFGCVGVGAWRRTCARSFGPSLHAQPAPWLYAVNLGLEGSTSETLPATGPCQW